MPYLKAHRPASSLNKGYEEPGLIGRTKGGLTSTLHVVCDQQGRPLRLQLSQGQCGDFTGADVLLRDLREATALMGDKGYESNKVRTMLKDQG